MRKVAPARAWNHTRLWGITASSDMDVDRMQEIHFWRSRPVGLRAARGKEKRYRTTRLSEEQHITTQMSAVVRRDDQAPGPALRNTVDPYDTRKTDALAITVRTNISRFTREALSLRAAHHASASRRHASMRP
jgi:hypothetical protein